MINASNTDSITQHHFLDSVSCLLADRLVEKIIPFWYGTEWDFNGTEWGFNKTELVFIECELCETE